MNRTLDNRPSQNGGFLPAWERALRLTGIDSRNLLSSSRYDPGRRIYIHNGNIVKLTLLKYQTSSNFRTQSLWGEFLVLKRCEGIQGIAQAIRWECDDTYEMLILTRVNIDHSAVLSSVKYFLHSLYHLTVILFKMALRGVCHNDLSPDNILISVDTNIYLIDFDQATISTIPKAFARSFLGLKFGDPNISMNMTQFLKNQAKAILPARVTDFIRRTLRKSPERLPSLADNADHTAKELLRAWEISQASDASSPGAVLAYYSLAYGEYRFPGERPWERRWDTLKLITDYTGKRVLELGCNMSLLSCYLLLQGGAESALAVDIDADILESAKLVSSALSVSPEYMQIDLDSKYDWETDLATFSPDIVFALNVLNWVQDKSRLLNFLGRFDKIIFEGHDSFEVERERFENVGFNNIKIVSLTERNRPLMYCVK